MQHLAELRYINTIVLYLRFETKHKTLNCRTPSPTQPRPVLAGRAVNREQPGAECCAWPHPSIHGANPPSRSKRLPVCHVCWSSQVTTLLQVQWPKIPPTSKVGAWNERQAPAWSKLLHTSLAQPLGTISSPSANGAGGFHSKNTTPPQKFLAGH